MRIPDAYTAGFGKMVTPVTPVLMPDNSGAEQIGAAGMRLGNTLLNIATDQIQYQQNIKDVEARAAAAEQDRIAREAQAEAKRQEREAEQERKQLAREEAGSEAEKQFLSYGQYLGEAAGVIAQNPDLKKPEDKLAAFEQTANEVRADFMSKLPDPLIRTRMDVHITRATMGARKVLDETLAKESADRIRANQKESLNIVVNSGRPLSEKLGLIDSLDLSTYNQTEQGDIRRNEKDRASRLEVDRSIEATRDNPQKLAALKTTLLATDEAGTFAALPHLDQEARQNLVKTIDVRIQTSINQAEQRQREYARDAREKANYAISEFEGLINQGWIPKNTKEDNAYLQKLMSIRGLDPSFQRRIDKSVNLMNDFSHREQLRAKDPLGTAAMEQGYKLSPFNPADTQSVARRIDDMKNLGQRTPLTGPEIGALTNHLNTRDARSLTNYVIDLKQTMGPQMGGGFFTLAGNQVRVKDPAMATIFMLVGQGKNDAAKLYADGKEFLKGEGKDYLKEKTTMIQSTLDLKLDQRLGNALTLSPPSRNATKDAIAVAYLGAARQRHLPLNKVDEALLDEVQRQVVGEVVVTGRQGSWNEFSKSWKKTIIPTGMKADDFLNGIKKITPADVAQRGGIAGMSDADAAKFLKVHAWHESAGGGYSFYNEDRRMLMGKDGKPFVWQW